MQLVLLSRARLLVRAFSAMLLMFQGVALGYDCHRFNDESFLHFFAGVPFSPRPLTLSDFFGYRYRRA